MWGNFYCEFCQILKKHANKKSQKATDTIIYEDDQFFAFHDITKASAQQHVLVCTKKHVETALNVKDPKVLLRMREIGTKILDKLCDQSTKAKEYRFGFHLPPFNSINHIHLHCFVLPFSSCRKNLFNYGWMLYSVEKVIEKIKANQPPEMKQKQF